MSEALRVRASRIAGFLLATLALALPTRGEVARIEVTRRDDFGSHERVIGRVYFGIDPMNAANRVQMAWHSVRLCGAGRTARARHPDHPPPAVREARTLIGGRPPETPP